jgi:adenine C2-methylase RlmN of 23S rRNA A2503 and tRNA A37
MGMIGDLSPGEILEQVLHANDALDRGYSHNDDRIDGRKDLVVPNESKNLKNEIIKRKRIRNVVYMGQGEPL